MEKYTLTNKAKPRPLSVVAADMAPYRFADLEAPEPLLLELISAAMAHLGRPASEADIRRTVNAAIRTAMVDAIDELVREGLLEETVIDGKAMLRVPPKQTK